MAKRLIVLFDGTWNGPKNRTNVVRLRDAIASTGENDPVQPYLYDEGVGVHWDRLTGGVFGRGLSENIQQGYAWLSRRYQEGDEIFLFGYSRGAYTARSLVGLIRKCGLLRSPESSLIDQAYKLYRDKEVHPDSSKADAFRQAYSRVIRVNFIGVWDTVGSLGVPLSGVPFSHDYYQWHDTELSKIVDYAYHALALDEHREDFAATVWTKIKPENKEVEQRWFAGAHGNVGGGIVNDKLSNLPLKWLQDKATACGLTFTHEVSIASDDHLAPIEDSFGKFILGLYRLFKQNKRYFRPLERGVNELIDDSICRRWGAKPEYRPPTLPVRKFFNALKEKFPELKLMSITENAKNRNNIGVGVGMPKDEEREIALYKLADEISADILSEYGYHITISSVPVLEEGAP